MESENVREWVAEIIWLFGCWVAWVVEGYMNDGECMSRSSNGGDVFFAAISAAG